MDNECSGSLPRLLSFVRILDPFVTAVVRG